MKFPFKKFFKNKMTQSYHSTDGIHKEKRIGARDGRHILQLFPIIPSTITGQIFFTGWKNLDKTMHSTMSPLK